MTATAEKPVKVLFTSSCLAEPGKHISKGRIVEYDLGDQTDQRTLQELRSAGRIAPVTKENVALCIEELKREGSDIPAELKAAQAGFAQAAQK
jgi:hypothetical protein